MNAPQQLSFDFSDPAPTTAAPDAGDRAVELGSTPLSAHEKMAAAAFVVRIEKTRARLFKNRSTPEWMAQAACSVLNGHQSKLESSKPFTVRLAMAYPILLPKGV